MKKLLHERLREVNRLQKVGLINDGYAALYDHEAKALADEIERYYIPRPRFESGEPIDWNEGENIDWIETRFGEDIDLQWTINAVSKEGVPLAYAARSNEIRAIAKMKDGFVVRKQPKVYDADGVEINIGDKLWNLDTGSYGIIDSIDSTSCDKEKVFVRGVNENGDQVFNKCPEKLTHKEPLLDADGVPIKVGDTVWRKELKCKVIGIKNSVCVQSMNGGTFWIEPTKLTHKEPDSLEKVIESMVAYSGEYVMPDTLEDQKIYEWVNRLTTIMEHDND